MNLKKKFKIVSALSVFYDLRDPNKFIHEVKEILDEKGNFDLEHADLYCIIKNTTTKLITKFQTFSKLPI